jgi:hypothetical protein
MAALSDPAPFGAIRMPSSTVCIPKRPSRNVGKGNTCGDYPVSFVVRSIDCGLNSEGAIARTGLFERVFCRLEREQRSWVRIC